MLEPHDLAVEYAVTCMNSFVAEGQEKEPLGHHERKKEANESLGQENHVLRLVNPKV